MEIFNAEFLSSLLAIIGIDLVLAGDNAVVIALAARTLAPDQQRRAIIWGTLLAVGLRITLTAAVVVLLGIPYLTLVGGLLLLWIAWSLATQEEAEPDVSPADSMRQAIKTILVADFVMSLDNVLAVAAQAKSGGGEEHQFILIVIGLVISIPIVMGGATILLRLVKRFPVIVWIGALLIAYTGVELIAQEKLIHGSRLFEELGAGGVFVLEVAIAVLLMLAAWMWLRPRRSAAAAGADGTNTLD